MHLKLEDAVITDFIYQMVTKPKLTHSPSGSVPREGVLLHSKSLLAVFPSPWWKLTSLKGLTLSMPTWPLLVAPAGEMNPLSPSFLPVALVSWPLAHTALNLWSSSLGQGEHELGEELSLPSSLAPISIASKLLADFPISPLTGEDDRKSPVKLLAMRLSGSSLVREVEAGLVSIAWHAPWLVTTNLKLTTIKSWCWHQCIDSMSPTQFLLLPSPLNHRNTNISLELDFKVLDGLCLLQFSVH